MSSKPQHKYIGSDKYSLQVGKIIDRYPSGRPRTVWFFPHKEYKLKLEGGEQFVTMYVHDESWNRPPGPCEIPGFDENGKRLEPPQSDEGTTA